MRTAAKNASTLYCLLLSALLPTGSVWALDTAYLKLDSPQGSQCRLSDGVWECRLSGNGGSPDAYLFTAATLQSGDKMDFPLTNRFMNMRTQRKFRQLQGRMTARLAGAAPVTVKVRGYPWVHSEGELRSETGKVRFLRAETLARMSGSTIKVMVWLAADAGEGSMDTVWKEVTESLFIKGAIADYAATSN